jgi:hypothetical protein
MDERELEVVGKTGRLIVVPVIQMEELYRIDGRPSV